MTLQQFIDKWNGKYCEVAGSANAQNQCVDLANEYLRSVWGLPIVEWTNACDFPSKITNCDYIKNTPEGIPQEGDVVVWNSNSGGGYGHIAVYVDGTANKFNSFDQNWPTGTPCHVQGHYYTNIDGWLRKKGTMQDDKICLSKTEHDQLQEAKTYYQQFKDNGYPNVAEVKQLVEDLSKSIKDKNELISISEKKFEDLKREHNNLVSDICAEDALNCTQDYSTIKAEARKTGKYKTDAEDMSRNFASYKETSEKSHGELQVEVNRLTALLKQENILANSSAAELLRELIKKLTNILKRK